MAPFWPTNIMVWKVRNGKKNNSIQTLIFIVCGLVFKSCMEGKIKHRSDQVLSVNHYTRTRSLACYHTKQRSKNSYMHEDIYGDLISLQHNPCRLFAPPPAIIGSAAVTVVADSSISHNWWANPWLILNSWKSHLANISLIYIMIWQFITQIT